MRHYSTSVVRGRLDGCGDAWPCWGEPLTRGTPRTGKLTLLMLVAPEHLLAGRIVLLHVHKRTPRSCYRVGRGGGQSSQIWEDAGRWEVGGGRRANPSGAIHDHAPTRTPYSMPRSTRATTHSASASLQHRALCSSRHATILRRSLRRWRTRRLRRLRRPSMRRPSTSPGSNAACRRRRPASSVGSRRRGQPALPPASRRRTQRSSLLIASRGSLPPSPSSLQAPRRPAPRLRRRLRRRVPNAACALTTPTLLNDLAKTHASPTHW